MDEKITRSNFVFSEFGKDKAKWCRPFLEMVPTSLWCVRVSHRVVIEIPDAFAQIKFANEGECGRAWVATLPGLLEELLERWSCTPTGPVMHGQVGVVVPVHRQDLPPAVIKVSFPHADNVHGADAYAAWDGRGAVRLYARDDDRFAMLLEQASQRTLASVTDPEEALTIQGELTRRLSVPAPAGLPRLSERIESWEHEIFATAGEFGNPLPKRVLDAARATLRELGPDQPEMLVHADLHDANILASDREPWLAIDPKVKVGDPAHDALYVIFSPRHEQLYTSPNFATQVTRYLDIYCAAANLDPDRVRRWTQVGAVREALWGRQNRDPDRLIQAADRLARALAASQ